MDPVAPVISIVCLFVILMIATVIVSKIVCFGHLTQVLLSI
jgi:hypothetical protein